MKVRRRPPGLAFELVRGVHCSGKSTSELCPNHVTTGTWYHAVYLSTCWHECCDVTVTAVTEKQTCDCSPSGSPYPYHVKRKTVQNNTCFHDGCSEAVTEETRRLAGSGGKDPLVFLINRHNQINLPRLW